MNDIETKQTHSYLP